MRFINITSGLPGLLDRIVEEGLIDHSFAQDKLLSLALALLVFATTLWHAWPLQQDLHKAFAINENPHIPGARLAVRSVDRT